MFAGVLVRSLLRPNKERNWYYLIVCTWQGCLNLWIVIERTASDNFTGIILWKQFRVSRLGSWRKQPKWLLATFSVNYSPRQLFFLIKNIQKMRYIMNHCTFTNLERNLRVIFSSQNGFLNCFSALHPFWQDW